MCAPTLKSLGDGSGTIEEMKKRTFSPAPRVLFIHTGGVFGTLTQGGAAAD